MGFNIKCLNGVDLPPATTQLDQMKPFGWINNAERDDTGFLKHFSWLRIGKNPDRKLRIATEKCLKMQRNIPLWCTPKDKQHQRSKRIPVETSGIPKEPRRNPSETWIISEKPQAQRCCFRERLWMGRLTRRIKLKIASLNLNFFVEKKTYSTTDSIVVITGVECVLLVASSFWLFCVEWIPSP